MNLRAVREELRLRQHHPFGSPALPLLNNNPAPLFS